VNPRRLYRCRHDRMLAGVAGGMAEYLEVDPTVVRILWILSAFLGGFTILIYILLAFIMPLEPLPMPGAPGFGPIPGPATGTAADGMPATGAPAEGEGSTGATTTARDATSAASGAGWTTPQGWQPGGWAAHRHQTTSGQPGTGRAGLVIGVLLIAFGAITLFGAMVPAWAAAGLGPAFVLALGIALVVASTRRPAAAR